MSGSEIYNNFNLKKQAHLDARLQSVTLKADLPDIESNFIPEGGIIYVQHEKSNYQVQRDGSAVLVWVNIGGENSDKNKVGYISILPTTTILDCNLSGQPIKDCRSVVINVVNSLDPSYNLIGPGGEIITSNFTGSVNINSITNLPSNLETRFYVSAGSKVKFKHKDYADAGTNDIVIEDGFDYEITGRNIGNEFISFVSQNSVNVQVSGAQYIKKTEITKILNGLFAVVDDLTSSDSGSALSAKQGRILNESLELKQNRLIAGTKIKIENNSANKTSTISSIPRDWSKTTTPVLSTRIESYLVTLFNQTTSNDYRYVSGEATDGSTWLLPPGKLPQDFSNWVKLSPAREKIKMAKFKLFGEASLDSVFTSAGPIFTPWIRTAAPIFNNLGDIIDYNPDFNKFCFRLKERGVYRLKFKLIRAISGSPSDAGVMRLYRTSGLTSASSGIPVSSTVLDMSTGVLSEDILYYEIDTLVQVNSSLADNLDNTFIFGLSKNINSFTVASTPPGTLEIEKISNYAVSSAGGGTNIPDSNPN